MRRLKYQDDENPVALQSTLFTPTGVCSGRDPFPPILRDAAGVKEILADIPDGVGIDLEFSPTTGRPTILGIANRKTCVGIPWDAELCKLTIETAQRKHVKLVGHSVIGADRPVVEGATGVKTALYDWECSMTRFYLANQDFTKTPGKDEDEDDSGAMGFLGLWTMASLYTSLPNWKSCRGNACDGPCPLHQPFDYCAIDSWAGLEGAFNLRQDMAEKHIPERLYEDLLKLSEIADLMQRRGVAVDQQFVAKLEKSFEAKKAELFPFQVVGGKTVYTQFNPKSGKQVLSYFSTRGIPLSSTEKSEVRAALDKELRKLSLDIDEASSAKLPDTVDNLYRLWQYKDAGKGLASWFAAKYVDKDSLSHPRWIVCGTSTGRMASSNPNYTNIPARGFGAQVRNAIVPREKGLVLLKADASQMELRKCLHAAGVERKLSKDAFTDLVVAAAGKFDKAAELYHGNARDMAKSTSHAGNYGEGLQVLFPKDLDRATIKKEIDVGARLLFRDWEYAGGLVSFTGANLAQRIFGDKSYESRKKALEIQEIYFEAFPEIRPWQKKVSHIIQDKKAIQSGTGRHLQLYGSPEDNLKIALAFIGQGEGADFMQEKIRRYYDELGVLWLLFVHDEAVFEVPAEWSTAKLRDYTAILMEESGNLPGFSCPFKFKLGPSWGEAKGIELW